MADAVKGSRSTRWLAAGIVLLVLITAALTFINHHKGGLKEGVVVIKAQDTVLGSLDMAQLQKLPAAEKKIAVQPNCGGSCGNSAGNNAAGSSEHHFTGTSLLGVLNSVDPGLAHRYKKVIARGIDQYSQVLEMSEVLQDDNVYIVYADFGRPLKTRAGGEGSLSAVVCSDRSGQRFTNWLVSLELQ